jgi:hypothetical protein
LVEELFVVVVSDFVAFVKLPTVAVFAVYHRLTAGWRIIFFDNVLDNRNNSM